MIDYLTPADRLRAPPGRLARWLGEMWLTYHLKIARWELEQAEVASIEASWRYQVVKLQEKLKALGIDPDEEPTDLTKVFEFWLCIAILGAAVLCSFAFVGYRGALIALVSKVV